MIIFEGNIIAYIAYDKILVDSSLKMYNIHQKRSAAFENQIVCMYLVVSYVDFYILLYTSADYN